MFDAEFTAILETQPATTGVMGSELWFFNDSLPVFMSNTSEILLLIVHTSRVADMRAVSEGGYSRCAANSR